MKYGKGTLLVILNWYLLAVIVQSPIVPMPHAVLRYLITGMPLSISMVHVLASGYRIIGGVSLGLFVAIPVGLLIGRKVIADTIISPMLYLLFPLPKIAFLPVFMVLFGIGDASKIALIAVIVFFPAALSIRDGVKGISFHYIELARAYHLTPKQMLRHIIWPAVLPRIYSSVRITVGIAMSVLFINESYAASHGLGYMIMNSWVMAQYTAMYAGIVLLSLLGLSIYQIIDFTERQFVHR